MPNWKSSTCLTAMAAMIAAGNAQAQSNSATIQKTNVDGAAGIEAANGASGGITNASAGKIIIDETYTPVDTDKDGDLDGPFATGTGRAGIRTLGAYTGAVTHNGEITVEGKDSFGIRLGGPLTGRLVSDGKIAVTGDRSIGIATGDINGSARIAGTVTAMGKDASAVVINGNVSGALEFQGSIGATGYRYTTRPSDTSKLDADDLLQGGPAVSIADDVGGGIIFAIPPKDSSATDNDEDKDGIEDSKEGSAAITSLGSAAAVRIGAADHDITIGAVAGTAYGHGLIIDGTVTGNGLYAGIDGNGLQIGGMGGQVDIDGGLTVNGRVSAVSNGATATAIRIGSGSTVPEIRVGGIVDASGKTATAILIGAGAITTAIRNGGTIKATGNGTGSTSSAITDLSGTLATIENAGAISGETAINLSANSSGATIRQTVVTSGTAAPSISGAIKFGSGNDLFDIADGTVSGNTTFGTGNNALKLSGDAIYTGNAAFGSGNDSMELSGTSSFTGNADFGGGTDSLTLSGNAVFTGAIANGGGVALAINGGRLNLISGTTSLRTLNVAEQGLLGITLDTAHKDSTILNVSGAATFAEGAKVAIRLNGITGAEGRYSFLEAGSVTGAAKLVTDGALLPYMFKGAVATISPTRLAIDIARKNATELSLNRSQAAAYDAIYAALAKDEKVAAAYLSTIDGDSFRKQVGEMLPDHAGGTFEATSIGSRAMTGMLADPNAPFADQGKWGYWIQQVGFGRAKSIGDTASYDITGWGIGTGGEYKTGIGHFGLSIAYLHGGNTDGGTDNQVDSDQYETALYWRGSWGPFNAYARGSLATVNFKGKRIFSGAIGNEAIKRTAEGKWNGTLTSAAAGASYETSWGLLRVRPAVGFDYYRLREDGYSEKGGGDAFNLTIASRTSDELAVSASVATALEWGSHDPDSGWFRMEAEGGRRQLVGGSLGVTTAHFSGGQDFTLVPDERTSGWTGKLRAIGGRNGFRIAGEAGAEEQQGRAAFTLRASLMMGI